MRVAIAHYNGRISPLFDASRSIALAESEGYGMPIRIITYLNIDTDDMHQRIHLLKEHGVDALICGAISRPLEEALYGQGFEIDSFVSGDIEDVLYAWSRGSLRHQMFSMPGGRCPRHRRRNRGLQRGRGRQRFFHQHKDEIY